MLHNHGKILERISMSTVGDSTLPLGDTPLLGQYQFSTPEKTTKHKREGGNEKEDGKRKKAEQRIKKGKGEWQKKAEEADVPNKKKKVEGPRKEAFTDEQFDLVPLIQLKGLIPKIPKKILANRVPRKKQVQFLELQNIQSTAENLLQQVAPGEILVVENALMVDDDVEVGREVNFNAISSEYGGDLLMWKKGEEKDNDDKKDVEEKVKFEEEEVQEYIYPILQMEESKNGDEKVDGDEKVNDVAEEDDLEQPTIVVYYTDKKDVQPDNETMVVAEVAKTDIEFFNQEEVVGETHQASVDQITAVSVEEETLEVEKTTDEASQATYHLFTGNFTFIFYFLISITLFQVALMESEVDVTLKKRYALNEKEIKERAFIMACRMNQLHAHFDKLLPGVLLESFIQKPISQNEKNQVDQVWSLRKYDLPPEVKKDNRRTYMMIGEETICLNALCTLYPNQWLDNEVIDVYIKALIQYFDTQHHARSKNKRIILADIFVC
ncbi:hypothetical protein GIB67_041393 [Kingdonia uniflora]|uniref:Uncharacterized protein n=1 Tax=Kingdonia uniflora TaxID=39325 RepID=A0A7J7LRN4_9MAGN|nr:hypothetical protein GIB67_041393 [Kingdonia uniflora]